MCDLWRILMDENTFADNFFFCINIFLSHYFSLLTSFLSWNFEIITGIMKSLIAIQHVFVEVQLKKEKLKSVFWVQVFGCTIWYTSLPIDLDMSLITNASILNNFGLILHLWRKKCYLVKCLKNICGWKCHFWEICRSQGTSFTCDFYAFYQCKPSDWFLHQWNIVAKYAKQWQNLSEKKSSASENNQKKIVLN